MTNTVIDRIETKKAEKIKSFLNIALTIMVVIFLFKLYELLEKKNEIIGAWIDFLILFLGFFYGYWQVHKRNKNRLGQFIEWDLNTLCFKLPDNNSPITIDKENIEKISCDRDSFEITTSDNLILKLNIEDFGDSRNKIKQNFGIK